MSSRKMPVTQEIRAYRRQVAKEQKEAYDQLSLEEKLAQLPKDGAKRQRERLEKLIAEKNAPPPPKPTKTKKS